MTVLKKQWQGRLASFVIPRLEVAHRDLSRIAAILRDAADNEVWTELPTDDTKLDANKTGYSLEGWRVHFRQEFADLNGFETAHGQSLQGFEPKMRLKLNGYLASIPNISTSFDAVIANYKDANGDLISTAISQTDRDGVASAIEAELEV